MFLFSLNNTDSLVYIKNKDNESINIDIKNAYAPFGIDQYKTSSTLKCNIKDDYNEKYLKDMIDKIESNFVDFLEKRDLDTFIKVPYMKKGNFPILFTLNIPKNKGKNYIKCYNEEGDEIVLGDFPKKSHFHTNITIKNFSFYNGKWYLSLKVNRLILRSSNSNNNFHLE